MIVMRVLFERLELHFLEDRVPVMLVAVLCSRLLYTIFAATEWIFDLLVLIRLLTLCLMCGNLRGRIRCIWL